MKIIMQKIYKEAGCTPKMAAELLGNSIIAAELNYGVLQ
jgi:hypothetical protein